LHAFKDFLIVVAHLGAYGNEVEILTTTPLAILKVGIDEYLTVKFQRSRRGREVFMKGALRGAPSIVI
jgi:hypothetical protein